MQKQIKSYLWRNKYLSMANSLVKILARYGGGVVESPVWCFVVNRCGDNCTLCTNEYFGASLNDVKYKQKTTDRGGITCPDCLKIIREIKAIKL